MTIAHPHFQKIIHPHVRVVDGLRALGIFLVVWFHTWQQAWLAPIVTLFGHEYSFEILPRTGFIGVDILLFVSGFGLFYPYALYLFEKSSYPRLKQFIFNRIIRIVPSYYVALILCFLFFISENGPAQTSPLSYFLAHMSFTQIWFEEYMFSVSGIFWTLATEVQFYVLFPLIAWIFIRKPFLTFICMCFLAYAFRIVCLIYFPDKIEFTIRQVPAFFDIYACGMMSAYLVVWLRTRKNMRKYLLQPLFACIGVMSIGAFVQCLYWIFSYANIDHGFSQWYSWYRLVLAFLIMVFVLSWSSTYTFLQALFSNRLMLFVSMISYNWYLWHFLLLVELKQRHIPPWVSDPPMNDPNWQVSYFALAGGLGLAAAIFFTFALERPVVRIALKFFQKRTA
jgi:peptidoglycan/LPS O-acetylase OafA/YrhL